ncbi:ketopantoate reductase family protein [Ktedonosporobacter rubrisoli]|uniref:Ketopantoate reductase family protein n=1 Tax=Ktedonosporobacter rubrisoli TaxID=2509675 RepID=A0A4P6JNJ8_KTERU|nr:2-dehydropantoate 2-reductase N-terminal domain-containing protein [Ktedonosporobacter rubrisoli]QBD76642.1 ketopantoate reductase family protein [Ktedonosporobacter rubrisoli]
MNILVYGAGVIGSVYAANLKEVGHNVSLLARGQRAVSLRTHGIQLEDAATGRRTTTRVSVVEQLAPADNYDIVLVAVRLYQLSSILPILAANLQVPTLLFLLSNPAGMRQFEQLDQKRIVSGFPAVGGVRKGDVVHSTIYRQVPMMLGEADGRMTPRLRQLEALFKQAGFTVKLSSDMQTWLKTHALMDIGIIAAVLMAGGKSALLARSRRHVVMLVQAMREGLLALRAQGTPLTPFYLTLLFLWLPRFLTVIFFQSLLRSRLSTLGIDAHFGDDIDNIEEIRQMAREIKEQLRSSSLATPTLNRLIEALEQTTR